MNEILLIGSVIIIYGSLLVMFRLFGKNGLYCFLVTATIAANIEVLIVIKAFGMEMTLGNVLFASTFLVTDILSEIYGKKEAKKAVYLGIAVSILFIILSRWWLLYNPSSSDITMPAMNTIFSNTPRVMIVSMVVYAIVQQIDVWAYHKWWKFTAKKCGDSSRFLWLRNNGSTLFSQLLNDILFTLGAFLGIYEAKTLVSLVISGYIIYLATSIIDTPFMYLARRMAPKVKDTAHKEVDFNQ